MLGVLRIHKTPKQHLKAAQLNIEGSIRLNAQIPLHEVFTQYIQTANSGERVQHAPENGLIWAMDGGEVHYGMKPETALESGLVS